MRHAVLRARLAAVGRQSALLLGALTAANAANYLFHVVVSRLLGPRPYGALGALLALLIWLSIPLSAVQTHVAKHLAERRNLDSPDDLEARWTTSLRLVASMAVRAALVLAVLSPVVAGFLHLQSAVAPLLLALYLVPAALGAVLKGVFQGTRQFRRLAGVTVVATLGRLGLGIALVGAGAGIAGALAASLLSESLAVALALRLLRAPLPLRRAPRSDARLRREVMPLAVGLAGMWLLIELDLVLARHFLPFGASGSYAAAGVLARAVLFVPGAVSLVALSYFAEERSRGGRSFEWLVAASALTVGLCVPVAGCLWVARDLVVDLTFGARFAEAAPLLPILALGMMGMGLANLQLLFHVAAGSRLYLLLWPVAAVEATAIALFGSSPARMAWVVLATGWAVALGGLSLAQRMTRSRASLLIPTPEPIPPAVGQEPSAAPEVSLVMPVYNGGSGLVNRVDAALEALDDLGRTHELIVVSDGSNDRSDQALVEAARRAEVVRYPERQGKGVALRVGMWRARGELVAFVDGDGDLDLGYLAEFVRILEAHDAELVIGSKRHPLSAVEYPLARRTMSWAYQRLLQMLFGLNVTDTQTGMKLVRRSVLETVLPRLVERRFLFDLELLVAARCLGYGRIVEAPIGLHYRFSSTISLPAMCRIVLDTGAVFYRRYVLCSYEPVDLSPFAAAGVPKLPVEALQEGGS